MRYALDEVRDVKEYVTGLEVSPTGRCSLLKGLRLNSQSPDHLLRGQPLILWGDEFNSIGVDCKKE